MKLNRFQISDLFESCDCDLPAVRYVDWMGSREKYDPEQKKVWLTGTDFQALMRLCQATPCWNMYSDTITFDTKSKLLIKKYTCWVDRVMSNGEIIPDSDVNWDVLHGEKRKKVKFLSKRIKKHIIKWINLFNTYAGREDVLCVTCKADGENWKELGGLEAEQHPEFLARISDALSKGYSTVYLKLDSDFVKQKLEEWGYEK